MQCVLPKFSWQYSVTLTLGYFDSIILVQNPQIDLAKLVQNYGSDVRFLLNARVIALTDNTRVAFGFGFAHG